MKLPKMPTSKIDDAALLGRVRATVEFLEFLKGSGYELTRVENLTRILKDADSYDVYGRVCAFAGYMESLDYVYSDERAAYRAIFGEDFGETADEPEKEKA